MNIIDQYKQLSQCTTRNCPNYIWDWHNSEREVDDIENRLVELKEQKKKIIEKSQKILRKRFTREELENVRLWREIPQP